MPTLRNARQPHLRPPPRAQAAGRLTHAWHGVDRMLESAGMAAQHGAYRLACLALPFGAAPPGLAQALAQLFPHVDWRRLRPTDLVRIPLQVLWLATVRQQAAAGDSAKQLSLNGMSRYWHRYYW